MRARPSYIESPDKIDLATETIASTIRILKAAGFYDSEIQELFAQVAKRGVRISFWAEPLQGTGER
jgi:hypothetical protein